MHGIARVQHTTWFLAGVCTHMPGHAFIVGAGLRYIDNISLHTVGWPSKAAHEVLPGFLKSLDVPAFDSDFLASAIGPLYLGAQNTASVNLLVGSPGSYSNVHKVLKSVFSCA